nr:MAG TPA: hypothetical protein [Caudoviricetes sp.]
MVTPRRGCNRSTRRGMRTVLTARGRPPSSSA